MAKILILGAGVMGSAFSQLLADMRHEVCLVGTHLDREWIEAIRTGGFHPKLRVKLHNAIVPFTYEQLPDALGEDTDLIVLGVSSAGVNWAVAQLGPLLKGPMPIIMLTKGLAAGDSTLQILPDVVQEGLAGYGLKEVQVGAIGGPCIAGELAVRRESSVVIAHPDKALLDYFLDLLAAPYYHARPSTDIIGVEVCAALKNFYALAVSHPTGQLEICTKAENDARMYNPSAGLFTQALAEMEQIVAYMGGNAATVYGLAGAGDLYVTCQAGRNSRMGRLLGTGLRYGEAKSKHMPEDTVEGADLALTIGPTLGRLIEEEGLNQSALPLTLSIIDAICRNKPLQIPWDKFYW